MVMMADVNVAGIWMFMVSETTTSPSVNIPDEWVIIGLIVVIIVMVALIVYALYIYPKIHLYQQKKREVMLGATRKKKIAAKSKPKK